MVDEKYAKQQFAQFRGMPGEPADPRDIRDRAEVLASRSRSEPHCNAIVQRMLEILQFFPSVANIIQASNEVLDPQSTAAIARSRQCKYCRGDGWITKPAPFGVDVSYPCDHTGRIPEGKGFSMNAEIQSRYLREMEESAERQRQFQEARESGKLDLFEKNSAKARRGMVMAKPADLKRITGGDFDALRCPAIPATQESPVAPPDAKDDHSTEAV